MATETSKRQYQLKQKLVMKDLFCEESLLSNKIFIYIAKYFKKIELFLVSLAMILLNY